jgi:precorrin-8X/cobalt-precorrin-8 methylmutase
MIMVAIIIIATMRMSMAPRGESAGSLAQRDRVPADGDYLRDPEAIYQASFAAIRREAPIERLPREMQALATRLIHACAMPDILPDLAWTPNAVETGRRALTAGRPILVDAAMVAAGIRSEHLRAENAVVCTLCDPGVAERAAAGSTTRSAAAVDLWRDHLDGAIVAIGNAPTALFRLLELLEDGVPPPALVLAFPLGFVGAAEAKEALIQHRPRVPYVALRGRRGGSALAAAAVNALAREAQ